VTCVVASLPHRAWVGIRYGAERAIVEVVASGNAESAGLAEIALAEHSLHAHGTPGVSVVRTRAALEPFADALTLVVGRDDGISALVVVLRDDRMGRFVETEVEALSRSVTASVVPDHQPPWGAIGADDHVRARTQPPFFVLNLDYEAELAPLEHGFGRSQRGAGIPERLGARFEATVRSLTSAWREDDESTLGEGLGTVYPSYVVRTTPLRGTNGLRIGVTIERMRTRNAIEQAARKFRLSARELDVLALVLDGCETRRVAEVLRIAPSTATDHVKRLLAKTRSRNRAELVARALGWKNEGPKVPPERTG
jgi:DNA-binding CsgD family transcriptional regulator